MNSEKITSAQNSRIKNIVLLQEKSKERSKQQLFVVEGLREIERALAFSYVIEELFVCNEIAGEKVELEADWITEISSAVFKKIAYRENSDGVLAVVKQKQRDLKTLKLSDKPLVLILDSVEKPGNLGAILRTADAAKVDAILLTNPLCDIYNPNVVRSSVGCLFSQQIVIDSEDNILTWLKAKGITSFATDLNTTQWYHEANYTEASAILMGTESTGLSRFWLDNADQRIKIPMLGIADSLNVSVSTAVITFEAKRQRNFI